MSDTAIIFHNSRCSKSRQALKTLQEHNLDITTVEYLKQPLKAEQVKKLIKDAGLSVREAMRSKEDIYKQLKLDNPNLNENDLIDAIINNPILLNRPFVVTRKGTRLARTPETLAEIL